MSLYDTILFGFVGVVLFLALAVELWDSHRMKRWRQQRRRKTRQ